MFFFCFYWSSLHFASGSKKKTKVIKNNPNPVWNEVRPAYSWVVLCCDIIHKWCSKQWDWPKSTWNATFSTVLQPGSLVLSKTQHCQNVSCDSSPSGFWIRPEGDSSGRRCRAALCRQRPWKNGAKQVLGQLFVCTCVNGLKVCEQHKVF